MIDSNKHLDHDFSEGISYAVRENRRIITIDRAKARFRTLPWYSLGDFGRRKMENLLVLTNTSLPTKFVYV